MRTRRTRATGPSLRGSYLTVADAARRLAMSGEALHARIRRAATTENGVTLARLGGGVTAYLFGKKTWRVCFTLENDDAAT